MAKECPICGERTLELRTGEFRFDPPANIPGGTMLIQDTAWEECTACGEQLLPPELDNALEAEQYKRIGLLGPDKIKDARERAGLTQSEMSQFLGIGEKTYTRWESGRSIHSKSSDNLIRLADRYPELFVQMEAQRDPNRENLIVEYFRGLDSPQESNTHAMAAHGAELDPALAGLLIERLRLIAKSRKKG
ncbi:MAG: type II toxin-antitoxin system MqsA family antitoxin [Phycisphaerae bacterium]|jgi:putative zinc finger/helix-turn-helix YgiT family protein|nr:type II toxin-antitoxin system MqsA family antitoxin [Phycisphaerae bacterium]